MHFPDSGKLVGAIAVLPDGHVAGWSSNRPGERSESGHEAEQSYTLCWGRSGVVARGPARSERPPMLGRRGQGGFRFCQVQRWER